MGSDLSTIPADQKPSWFVEYPHITKRTGVILECSLRSMVGDLNLHKNMTLPLKLTDTFYSKLYEIEAIYPQNSISVYFEDSTFLASLLKLLVKVPQYTLESKTKTRKWRSHARSDLKKFIADYITLRLPCYVHAGEALFQCVKDCDSMYSSRVYNAWVNAYSEFLRHVVPNYYRERKKTRKQHKSLRESLDFSDYSDSSGTEKSSVTESPKTRKKHSSMRVRLAKRAASKRHTSNNNSNSNSSNTNGNSSSPVPSSPNISPSLPPLTLPPSFSRPSSSETDELYGGEYRSQSSSKLQLENDMLEKYNKGRNVKRRSKTLDMKFFRAGRSLTVTERPVKLSERRRSGEFRKPDLKTSELLDKLLDCSACGVQIRLIHKFCPNCGDPLELDVEMSRARREIMKQQSVHRSKSTEPRSTRDCRACGYQTKKKHRFCLNCGEEQ